MRHTLLIVPIFILAALEAKGQDYYSAASRINGADIEYIVSKKTYGHRFTIDLDNTRNILSNRYPYDMVAGQYYSFSKHPMPLAQLDYESLHEIITSVFSEEDISKYTSEDRRLYADFRIDPLTRHAIEIVFRLQYTSSDNRILALPIIKIEQLEAALKRTCFSMCLKKARMRFFYWFSGVSSDGPVFSKYLRD